MTYITRSNKPLLATAYGSNFFWNANEKLNDYLATWDLANPQLLAQPMTSHIYTVSQDNEKVILKVLSAAEVDEPRGAFVLRYFAGHGAVKVLR